MARNILASYDFKTAITVQGLASFNANISAFGTSTFWANQQLSLAVRNGVNAITNLVQYSRNDTTITGGITTTGLIWAGTTAMENNQGYGLTTSAYVSTTQATFTTNSAVTQTPFAVGQKLIVAGVTGGTYNGSFIITAIGGSAGAWTATVTSPSGTTPFTNVAGTGGTGSIEPALFVRQPSAGTPALTIKAYGTASGSTEPFRYIDSTGVVKTYIAASGDFVAPAISAIWSMTSSAQDVTVNAMRARTSVASGYRANLQTWESSTTVLAGINAKGQFFTGGTSTLSGSTTATTAASAASTTAATFTVGTVSTVNPYAVGQVVTTAGFTAETYFNSSSQTSGTFYVTAIGGSSGAWTVTVLGSGFTVASATVQGTITIPVQTSITPSSAGTIGLVIRGTTSQSADLQQWQTSAPTTVASISSTGQLSAVGVISSGSIQITGANSPLNLPTGNGTSGQYLASTGTGTTPIWSAPALGKKIIQTATLSGTSAISFTSIPSTYRDLEIRILATTAVTTSTSLTMTVNGLTTNIYATVHQYVNGVSPGTISYSQQTGATSANLSAPVTFGGTASSSLTYTLNDYTSGSFKNGTVTWMGGPQTGTYYHGTGGIFLKTTAAITQIDIAVAGTGGITGSAVLIGVY